MVRMSLSKARVVLDGLRKLPQDNPVVAAKISVLESYIKTERERLSIEAAKRFLEAPDPAEGSKPKGK